MQKYKYLYTFTNKYHAPEKRATTAEIYRAPEYSVEENSLLWCWMMHF